jgi:hypothetical protein
LPGIKYEPDKDVTGAALEVTFKESTGIEASKRMFVKCQSGRGMPIFVQAFRAAQEKHIAREVDFYNLVAHIVPVKSPKVLFADKCPLLNRVFIIQEFLDLSDADQWPCKSDEGIDDVVRVIPDNILKSIDDIGLLVSDVAKMHAMFLERVNIDKATKWIPAKKGLDFCLWMSLAGLSLKLKPEVFDMFNAISLYYEKRPITLVHGDCRPGNMFFVGGAPTKAKSVIFGDWEALNAAPPCWDFVYCTILGLDPDQYINHRDSLLSRYYSAFVAAAADPKIGSGVKPMSLESFKADTVLLPMVLFYLGFVVSIGGYWNKQGNSRKDKEAWLIRINSAMQHVDEGAASKLLADYGITKSHIQSLKRISSNWVLGRVDDTDLC